VVSGQLNACSESKWFWNNNSGSQPRGVPLGFGVYKYENQLTCEGVDWTPLHGEVRIGNLYFQRMIQIVDVKDSVAIAGVGVTLIVSSANLAYSLWSNRQTSFVNTVTTARLKWIDSLRDKVSEFLAVTSRLKNARHGADEAKIEALSLQRDTLLHQIVLHLNPHDAADQRIKTMVDHVQALTDQKALPAEFAAGLVELRNAAGDYLKKEWNRVKQESTGQSR
jgi:hypothetical protein